MGQTPYSPSTTKASQDPSPFFAHYLLGVTSRAEILLSRDECGRRASADKVMKIFWGSGVRRLYGRPQCCVRFRFVLNTRWDGRLLSNAREKYSSSVLISVLPVGPRWFDLTFYYVTQYCNSIHSKFRSLFRALFSMYKYRGSITVLSRVRGMSTRYSTSTIQ